MKEIMSKSLLPGKIRDGLKFYFTNIMHKPAYRPVQMVSLGCHGKGAALPHPDSTDPESCLLGQNRRVCFDPPVINRRRLRRFRRFVKKWLKKNLVPLPYDANTTIEFWLSLTNYPEWRKQQLRDEWSLIEGVIEQRHFVVNNFIKDETYPCYKNLRGINARTDAFKVAVGPIFKLIEKEVFKSNWFIKKVPVPERPRYIYDLLFGNFDYYGTDHTSFEGHFSKEFMEACEFQLYDYMTQHVLGGAEFYDYVHNVLGGNNFVTSKWFSYNILATRMTGEMCTSLGNGFSNLMLLLFMAEESGVSINGVVEGDDSLFAVPVGAKLKTEVFKELGFTIKMEKFDCLNEASFCGNLFAVDDFYVVTNPVEALLSFGWTSARYAKSKNSKLLGLLRSKSLSLLYEYRGAPILKNLALYGLRMTEGYRARQAFTNEYQREQLKQQLEDMKNNGLPIIEIPMATRLLVEKLFKISVEVQLKYESYLDSLTNLEPLDLNLLEIAIHPDQVHYYVSYVKEVRINEDNNHPEIPDISRIVWNKDYEGFVNSTRSAYRV